MDLIYNPDRYKRLIKDVTTLMRYYRNLYETIAFTGMSGAAVAYPVSLRLGKHLTNVRKQNDSSHYTDMDVSTLIGKFDNPWLEGRAGFYEDGVIPYCIVDDFVETGETIKYIADQIGYLPACVFLYFDRDFDKVRKAEIFSESWQKVPFYLL